MNLFKNIFSVHIQLHHGSDYFDYFILLVTQYISSSLHHKAEMN